MTAPARIQQRRTKGWRKPDQPCHADVPLELANDTDRPGARGEAVGS